MPLTHPLIHAAARRREALAVALPATPVLLASGAPPARNYPNNHYSFRSYSHFVHVLGVGLSGCFVWLDGARACLLVPAPTADDALWHGARDTHEILAERLGIDVLDLDQLPRLRGGRSVATLRPPRADDALALAGLLGRALDGLGASEDDGTLADAIIANRLAHDDAAVAELMRAADATVLAHRAGMAFTRAGVREYQVAAAMEHTLAQQGAGTAYPSIVTCAGEVLHNHPRDHTLADGELLLSDVGAETAAGYAGDVTRTWPVSGRFSGPQRAIYDVVLASQAAAIALVRPGVRYRDVHLVAAKVLTEGLVHLGLLEGDADALVEDGVHALFMPHGIGHLLGLDVHDMEDLGDRAGYAPGRTRASQFGLSYLRLDRDLAPGMAVTIEPGFYQVPMLLADPARFGIDPRPLKRERLESFADVRGIRIEDDVLVTDSGNVVLTAGLPKDAVEIEALVGRA